MSDRDPPAQTDGAAGRPRAWWARPQVLAATLVLGASVAFFVLSRPPEVGPVPTVEPPGATDPEASTREVTLFRVVNGVETPLLREVPAPDDPSARAQALVDALRTELLETGDWPDGLSSPRVYAVRVGRDDAVVLDLPATEGDLDVARERTLLASLERTLVEQGTERIAYLRDGRAVDAWLGNVLTPASLE